MASAAIWDTALENWPPQMISHLSPFNAVPLEVADLVFLLAHQPGELAVASPNTLSEEARAGLAEALAAHPEGLHLRLGLCSFQTTTAQPPVTSLEDALRRITMPNRRVASILDLYLADEVRAELFCFPWVQIAPWQELGLGLDRRSNPGSCDSVSDCGVHGECSRAPRRGGSNG